MENELTIQEQINRIEGEINGLLAYMKDTDWCVTKSKEIGMMPETLYPDETAKRSAARDRINKLQAQLPALYDARQAEIEQLQAQPEIFYPDETVESDKIGLEDREDSLSLL